jgi:hypothetical protein
MNEINETIIIIMPLAFKYVFHSIYKGWICDISAVTMKYTVSALPPLICPFVQTADIEMLVTIVTMLARHIIAVPSPKTFIKLSVFTWINPLIFCCSVKLLSFIVLIIYSRSVILKHGLKLLLRIIQERPK